MSPTQVSEIEVTATLAEKLRRSPEWKMGVTALERRLLQTRGESSFAEDSTWSRFVEEVHKAYGNMDFVVVRNFPLAEDGSSLLMAALAASSTFRPYRSSQIVKRFNMSPWVKGLSHTTREGDFHTDLNTEESPPKVTAIQCLYPDPGAPQFGQNRVARLPDLIRYLEQNGQDELLEWLQNCPVKMSNGRGQSWTGEIVRNGELRYHPTTLLDAEQPSRESAEYLPEATRQMHEAALAVSEPFDLRAGDVLLVSNRRALHYRGECSVKFLKFPTEYEARSIFVLHQLDEPR